MRRDVLGFATLLSVPPGVGIAIATLRVGGDAATSLSAVAGVTTTVALFSILVLVFSGGSVDEADG